MIIAALERNPLFITAALPLLARGLSRSTKKAAISPWAITALAAGLALAFALPGNAGSVRRDQLLEAAVAFVGLHGP